MILKPTSQWAHEPNQKWVLFAAFTLIVVLGFYHGRKLLSWYKMRSVFPNSHVGISEVNAISKGSIPFSH